MYSIANIHRIFFYGMLVMIFISIFSCTHRRPMPPIAVLLENQPSDAVGKASCASILRVFVIGDCSIEAAKKDGRLASISHVDEEVYSIPILYTKRTLMAHGVLSQEKPDPRSFKEEIISELKREMEMSQQSKRDSLQKVNEKRHIEREKKEQKFKMNRMGEIRRNGRPISPNLEQQFIITRGPIEGDVLARAFQDSLFFLSKQSYFGIALDSIRSATIRGTQHFELESNVGNVIVAVPDAKHSEIEGILGGIAP